MRADSLFRYRESIYTIFCIVFSCSYSYLLFSLPVDIFVDRDNYFNYAQGAAAILLKQYDSGFFVLFFNEPVWLFLNIFLSLFLSPPDVVRTLIFFSSFIFSYKLLRSRPEYFLILLLFLVMPQVVKNYIIHLRQGVGLAFFMLGYFSRNKIVKVFFVGVSPFVHSSFFFVTFFYVVGFYINNFRLYFDIKFVVFLTFSVLVSVFSFVLADFFGARQAQSLSNSSDGSGIGFLFWFVIFFLYLSQGDLFFKKNSFSMLSLVFYLCAYFTIPVSARIFESCMIFVLISSFDLGAYRRYLAFLAFLLYTVAIWVIKSQLPLWGFAGVQ